MPVTIVALELSSSMTLPAPLVRPLPQALELLDPAVLAPMDSSANRVALLPWPMALTVAMITSCVWVAFSRELLALMVRSLLMVLLALLAAPVNSVLQVSLQLIVQLVMSLLAAFPPVDWAPLVRLLLVALQLLMPLLENGPLLVRLPNSIVQLDTLALPVSRRYVQLEKTVLRVQLLKLQAAQEQWVMRLASSTSSLAPLVNNAP
jgi:hypothetical protein